MRPHPPRAVQRLDCDRRIHATTYTLRAARNMQLSLDAVVVRANCSTQTLYRYYGCGKNWMHDGVLEHVHLAIGRLGTVSDDLHADLLAFALPQLDRLNNLNVLETCVMQSCGLVEAESHRFRDQLQQLFRDGVAGKQPRLAHRFEQAVQAGQRPHEDPYCMAELLLSMTDRPEFDRQRFHAPHRVGLPTRQHRVQLPWTPSCARYSG